MGHRQKITRIFRTDARTIRRGLVAILLGSGFAFQTTIMPVAAQVSDYDAVIKGFPAYQENCGQTEGQGKTIVLDPGHSGEDINTVNATTGLRDHDYPNDNENEEVFYVSLKVKKLLQDSGYRVILTKGDSIATDAKNVEAKEAKEGAKINASLESRAKVANDANADLAVSIHNDHKQPWSWGEIYVQDSSLFRTGEKGKKTFKEMAGEQADDIAKESKRIAGKINESRKTAEGKSKDMITNASFDNRKDIDPGNIPMVMLYAKVPWVYNEVGASPVGKFMSQEHLDAYANGIADGIQKALPRDTATKGQSNYIAVKGIPAEGLEVGASVYGGEYKGGDWGPDNGIQGGGDGEPYDDTGYGYIQENGKDVKLPGRAAFAELMDGNALGNLPPHTKIEISYKGKTAIAEKLDIGGGGGEVKGKPRAVDLWWELARYLDFKGGLDVITIHAVSDGAKPTNVNSDAREQPDNVQEGCCNVGKGNTQLIGGDNVEYAYKFFILKGLTKIQSAAILGNLIQESHVNPTAVNPKSGAYGIAQWLGSRKTRLEKFARDANKPKTSLVLQLDYLWWEITEGPEQASLKALKQQTSLDVAVRVWEQKFERAGPDEKVYEKRIEYAQGVLSNPKFNAGVSEGGGGGECQDSVSGCGNAELSQSNRLVQVACAELFKKVIEDAGFNCDSKKRITAYAKATPGWSSCGPPYCAMFMYYVHKEAGYEAKGANALAVSWRDWYRSKGAWTDRAGGAKAPTPGGAVVYGGSGHVGMVVSVDTKNRTMDTIEANTSAWARGSGLKDNINTSSVDGVHFKRKVPYYTEGSILGWGDPTKVWSDLK